MRSCFPPSLSNADWYSHGSGYITDAQTGEQVATIKDVGNTSSEIVARFLALAPSYHRAFMTLIDMGLQYKAVPNPLAYNMLKCINELQVLLPEDSLKLNETTNAMYKKLAGMSDDDTIVDDTIELRSDEKTPNHYAKCSIQPHEYATANNMGFLEGNVVKYVTRYKDKGGAADIDKAIHYLELIKQRL